MAPGESPSLAGAIAREPPGVEGRGERHPGEGVELEGAGDRLKNRSAARLPP